MKRRHFLGLALTFTATACTSAGESMPDKPPVKLAVDRPTFLYFFTVN